MKTCLKYMTDTRDVKIQNIAKKVYQMSLSIASFVILKKTALKKHHAEVVMAIF